MKSLIRILSSRRASLVLMIFIAVVSALGAWVPQQSASTPDQIAEWAARRPAIAGIAAALGLHSVFSSWWFLAGVAIFIAALALATGRMLGDAAKAWRGSGRPPRTRVQCASEDELAQRALAAGYRERAVAGDARILTRHRLGVWAPAIFHVGLLISFIAAAAALTSAARAIVDFSQGQIRLPGEPYLSVDSGVLGEEPEISYPLRFDGFEAESWPGGGLKDLSATLSVLEPDGDWRPEVTRVNHPLRVQGHTIYVQPGEFGEAVFLEVTAPDGVVNRVRMDFYYLAPGEVQYTVSPTVAGSLALDGRWDPQLVRSDGPLALRPTGDDSAEPVTLWPGDNRVIGGASVEFVAATQWARFAIINTRGIEALFLGFAIIGLGSLMLYAWIPRELVLKVEDGAVYYSWHAARMGRGYIGERDSIIGSPTDAVEGT